MSLPDEPAFSTRACKTPPPSSFQGSKGKRAVRGLVGMTAKDFRKQRLEPMSGFCPIIPFVNPSISSPEEVSR